MRLSELLSEERIAVRHNGDRVLDKPRALRLLAEMLARGAHASVDEVERVLVDREGLQSTGIGEGVAIPHGAMGDLVIQFAALLIVPEGLEFAAIDGLPVNLLFAVVTPKRATGEHLKTLARVSRLLRSKGFRDRLIAAEEPRAAYELIASEEGER